MEQTGEYDIEGSGREGREGRENRQRLAVGADRSPDLTPSVADHGDYPPWRSR